MDTTPDTISLGSIVDFIKNNTKFLGTEEDKSKADALTAESPDLNTMRDLLIKIEDGDRKEKEIEEGIHHDEYPDNQIALGDHSIADVISHVDELIRNKPVGGGKRKSRKNKRSRKTRKSTKTKRSRKSRKTTRRRRVRKHR